MAQPDPPRIWQQLPPELAEHVISFLPPNEVACTARLINKAAAAQFSGPEYSTVHMSQPSPPHAFEWRWCRPGVMRGLTLKRRRELLCLTARSGSIPNLEAASEHVRCLLTKEVSIAAATAGQLDVCRWLLQQGCRFIEIADYHKEGALYAAAEAGQQAACEWMLANGCCPWHAGVVLAAARGGHEGLMRWLLQLHPEAADELRPAHLLLAAVWGFDLPTVQRLLPGWLDQQALQDLHEFHKKRILAAAAGSTTADWQAKVAWLETLGFPWSDDDFSEVLAVAAGSTADAVERLTWLQQRGYQLVECSRVAACQAAGSGRLEVLQYLLHAHGNWDTSVFVSAAENGHLSVVAWLLETVGGHEFLAAYLLSAAKSGNVALLSWLRGRGCDWNAEVFAFAARGGSEEALEWLAEQGCPMGDDGEPYVSAASNGDLATLRCLRRLDCPWGPEDEVFTEAVNHTSQRAVLQWLLEEGCPVDWDGALEAVEFDPDTRAWLQQQRQERG